MDRYAHILTLKEKIAISMATLSEWITKETVFGTAAVSLLGGTFLTSTAYLGSKNDYHDIKHALWTVVVLAVVGAVILGLAIVMYYVSSHSTSLMYVELFMAIFALGMSFAALSIGSISWKTKTPDTTTSDMMNSAYMAAIGFTAVTFLMLSDTPPVSAFPANQVRAWIRQSAKP